MSIPTILLIVGFVAFMLSALSVQIGTEKRKLNLDSLGFAMWTAAVLAGFHL